MKDKNWINPPHIIIKKGQKNAPKKLSYWIDSSGKYQLYTKKQLTTLNILTNLNSILVRALVTLDKINEVDENIKIKTLMQQESAKFEAGDSSIFKQFITLMASAPDITFGEFLGFLSANSDPKAIAKMGKKPTFTVFYTSDRLKKN